MAQPGRACDALYDNLYVVSGPRDHFRQQSMAGGFNLERAPEYKNMFSELPHFPSTTFRIKPGDKIPAFIDRTYHPPSQNIEDLSQRSQPAQVSGAERPKYFRRPLLAPAEINVKQAITANQSADNERSYQIPEPPSKTVGTQSDYRESEAQTKPWDPNYVLPEPSIKQRYLSEKHHCDGPELLQLRDLNFPDSLPPGLQEARRVERMREKRAFEATLPPLDDLDQMPLRQRMIEEWEAREWQEREAEILSVQNERLALLETAIAAREEEAENAHTARVEAFKESRLKEHADQFAFIQGSRLKTVRQLVEARKYVEKHQRLHKQTYVEKYADFGSSVYAPLQREGRFPEDKPAGQQIETDGFTPHTVQELVELENFLPAKLLTPKMTAPKRLTKLNYQQRQDASIQRDLTTINKLLDTSKATLGRGHGQCWPAPLKESPTSSPTKSTAAGSPSPTLGGGGGGSPERSPGATGPLSPLRKSIKKDSTGANAMQELQAQLPPPPQFSSPRDAALVLLQRLLRGRAAQNIMFECRVRRQELIDELKVFDGGVGDGAGASSTALATSFASGRNGNTGVPGGNNAFSAPPPRPRMDVKDDAARLLDATIGSAVSDLVLALLETNPERRRECMIRIGLINPSPTIPNGPESRNGSGLLETVGSLTHGSLRSGSRLASPMTVDLSKELDAARRFSFSPAATRLAVKSPGLEERGQGVGGAAAAASGKGDGDDGRRNDDGSYSAASADGGSGGSNRRRAASDRDSGSGSGDGKGGGDEDGKATSPLEEEEEAVVRIQAAFRGFKARREVAAMRSKTTEGLFGSRADSPASIGMGEGDALDAAIESVQAPNAAAAADSGVDGVADDDDINGATEEAAVVRIQAAFRGMKARRDVSVMRKKGAALRKKVIQELDDLSPEDEQKLIKCQAAARGYLARKKVNQIRQDAS